MKDFDDAIDRIIAGLEKKRVMSDKERASSPITRPGTPSSRRVLPGLDPVHKISIVRAASARSASRCSCRSRIDI